MSENDSNALAVKSPYPERSNPFKVIRPQAKAPLVSIGDKPESRKAILPSGQRQVPKPAARFQFAAKRLTRGSSRRASRDELVA